ncbi:MAG: GNAT family N-acetyltransferase [Pseudomonadota bacterium]
MSTNEPSGIHYRTANESDAQAISKLILDSQAKFTFHEYSDAGREFMLRLCSEAAINEYLQRGDTYFVAEHDAVIIGVIGIRDAEHISHNFVDDAWHGRGISSALWRLGQNACRAAGNPGVFTLRASTYAIPIYEKWGFIKTAAAEDTGGIISTPMRLDGR